MGNRETDVGNGHYASSGEDKRSERKVTLQLRK
jgi:hypothetical protein